MEKLDRVKKSFAIKSNIHKDFFANSETTVSSDSLMLDILTSEFDCMESIVMLLGEKKFEDCYILLRHVLETFLYLWLMLEGEVYQYVRKYRFAPLGNNRAEARDKTFEKWVNERRNGLPHFKDVTDIQKEKEDAITVTYQSKGLFSSNDPQETDRIVPWYIFAFEDYDPDKRFLADLPSVSIKEHPRVRQILKEKTEEQKMLYHKYFYINSIMRNLKLNKLITDETRERLTVHYNFFSSFLHPNKRIVRTRPSDFSFSFFYRNLDLHSELVLLYLCRLQFLFLSKMITHFEKSYPRGNYEEYKKHAKELDEASKDLWFFDNSPHEYDLEESRRRVWWLKQGGEDIDEARVFYYTDPISRLSHVLEWNSKLA